MRKLACVLLVAAGSILAAAQDDTKNELAVTVGRTFISDQTVPTAPPPYNVVHSGKGLSFDFSYARRLKDFNWGTLALELPVIFNPDEDINFGQNQVPNQYRSLFATPAARVSFLRALVFSPWVSFGGGVGYFVSSRELVFFGQNTGHRIKATGVMHGGVGFDVHIPWKHEHLGFRFEARDNWSGVPPINVITDKDRQHNYYVGAGIVAHF